MTTPMHQASNPGPVKMTEGPAVEPAGPLLAWLNQSAKGEGGKRRRFRLPLVVRFEDEYRLGYGDVFVGRSLKAAPADAIHVSLDDTALSSPLLQSIAARCPKEAPGCVLLVEGYWGPLVEGGPPDIAMPGEAKKWPFAVLTVHGLLPDGAPEAARAQGEVP